MDELIIREIIKRWLTVAVLFLCSAVIIMFFVIGIYDAFWNVPSKVARITELTIECEVRKHREKELEKYIAEQEKKYKLATRWSDFLGMMCDNDQKVRLDVVEDYIVQQKGLYKEIKNGEIDKSNEKYIQDRKGD